MQWVNILRKLIFIPVVAMVVTAVSRLDRVTRLFNEMTDNVSFPAVMLPHSNPAKKSVSLKFDITELPDDNRCDLNKAELSELDLLPGVGRIRAEAIIQQRIRMGGFYSVEDVLCTPGIGVKTLNKFKDMVTVSNRLHREEEKCSNRDI